MDKIRTGYFARVAGIGRCWSQTHVFRRRKALCGYVPAKSMFFQWCANGIMLGYIECLKCKEKAEKIKIRESSERLQKLSIILDG